MTPLIGLHGPIGSGKDTLARLLTDEGYRRIKFADPLYNMCHAIDPVFHPDMPHKAKQGYVLNNAALGSRRNFLERLATDCLRNLIHESFFTLYMEDSILESIASAPSVGIVVSDVRFENEASLIRKLGGHIIHLKPDWPCESTGHSSDSGIRYNTGDSILSLQHGRPDKGYKQLVEIIGELYTPSKAPGFVYN